MVWRPGMLRMARVSVEATICLAFVNVRIEECPVHIVNNALEGN